MSRGSERVPDPGALLGLARRAGALAIGAESAAAAARVRQARLVVLAHDAGRNTCGRFITLCRAYAIPMARFATRDELGHAIGRPPTAVVAVTQEALAAGLSSVLETAVPAADGENGR